MARRGKVNWYISLGDSHHRSVLNWRVGVIGGCRRAVHGTCYGCGITSAIKLTSELRCLGFREIAWRWLVVERVWGNCGREGSSYKVRELSLAAWDLAEALSEAEAPATRIDIVNFGIQSDEHWWKNDGRSGCDRCWMIGSWGVREITRSRSWKSRAANQTPVSARVSCPPFSWNSLTHARTLIPLCALSVVSALLMRIHRIEPACFVSLVNGIWCLSRLTIDLVGNCCLFHECLLSDMLVQRRQLKIQQPTRLSCRWLTSVNAENLMRLWQTWVLDCRNTRWCEDSPYASGQNHFSLAKVLCSRFKPQVKWTYLVQKTIQPNVCKGYD